MCVRAFGLGRDLPSVTRRPTGRLSVSSQAFLYNANGGARQKGATNPLPSGGGNQGKYVEMDFVDVFFWSGAIAWSWIGWRAVEGIRLAWRGAVAFGRASHRVAHLMQPTLHRMTPNDASVSERAY